MVIFGYYRLSIIFGEWGLRALEPHTHEITTVNEETFLKIYAITGIRDPLLTANNIKITQVKWKCLFYIVIT